jgi:uncharacterized protein (DUF885 family)
MREAVLIAFMLACGSGASTTRSPMQTAASKSPLAADAIAGVTDPALQAAIGEHWEFLMRWSPTFATTLGDHRYDDKLAPRDAAAMAKAKEEREAVIAKLEAVDAGALDATDRVTHALLRGQLVAEREHDRCKFWQWTVDSGGSSLLGELSYLVESHTVKTAADAKNLIARMQQADRAIDDTIANLTLGLDAGLVSSAEKVRRALEQLDTELAKPVETWAMAKPVWEQAPAPDPWAAGERARLVGELREVIAAKVKPALGRMRELLATRIMPKARKDKEGLSGLPGEQGAACYRASIMVHVGLAMTPDELHALGQAEIARSDAEIAKLGKQLFGTPDLASTIARLRTDKSLYFTSGAEILASAQKSLDRAKATIPKYFAVLPKADCVMREIAAHEAPYSTIAYYRAPHYDGSKPGEYFVNTYKPETRPRFELEALTWHESIPGHHLQIAIARELGAMPMFRKLDGSTAFIEGWALYTERLADEMGMYTADLDRLGKLSYDAWRGSRLVVDTGLHAMGWTRAQAEAFMRDHTALTEVNISNEVDRYIGWPGQALAYKVGQLEIFKLRAEAEKELGAAFDIKAFHAIVLGAGAVTLPVLDERVRSWVAGVKARTANSVQKGK